ncbi:hypothetical protein ACVKXF_002254 [Curtobacterium sp. PvP017]
MPSRSASRPRPSAPERCPSPEPHPRRSRSRFQSRSRSRVRFRSRFSANGRNTRVPRHATAPFRPLAVRSGRPACPPCRAGETPACHPTRPRHFAHSRWAHWSRPSWRPGARPADRLRASRQSPQPPREPSARPVCVRAPRARRAGETPGSPLHASLAFRPLAVGALVATSLEARRPPGGPAPGLQAVTTTAPRASASSGLLSGRNTRVAPPHDRGISPARALDGRRCAAAHGAHAGRE